jgi:tetratricopeptide (TPR) repeat protein
LKENFMTSTAVRLATLAIAASVAFALSPSSAFSAGSADPPPPPSDAGKGKGKGKGKGGKQSERFLDGYKSAYAAIYQRHDYAGGIAQLEALKRDDHADVANLIGYSWRKLGDYERSKLWYEAALKADPTHVRTWQYYGLWQLERGNRAQAQVHLDKIASLCGTSCAEFRSLSEAMGTVAAGGRLVY